MTNHAEQISCIEEVKHVIGTVLVKVTFKFQIQFFLVF